MSWGYVAIGAATLIGSVISSESSKDASEAQVEGIEDATDATVLANRESIAAQKESLERLVELNEPFREVGLNNISKLQEKLDKGYPTFDEFVESPEAAAIRKAELDDIADAVDSSASARGNLFAPSTQLAIQDEAMKKTRSSKLGQYDSMLAREDSEINNLFNSINVGRGATTTQSNAVSRSGENVSNIINTGGTNLANLNIAAGNSRASNYVNQGNIWGNAISNIGKLAFNTTEGV